MISAPKLQPGIADEAGLDPHRLLELGILIDEAIEDGVFPGAAILLARGGVAGCHDARGFAQVAPTPRSAAPDTIYDLASLTKVLAALPVSLALWERGRLDLDAPVNSILPEFSGGMRDSVTPRHLLAHTSGLPSWKALYLHARDRDSVLAQICATPLAADPGTTVEYSDLGILLLGASLERLTGKRIDQLVQETVIGPLGLTETMYNPPPPMRNRCAATESGHTYEREKVGANGLTFSWRRDVLVGEVHDGNAHYALGGVAPHAGLFSTAWEVATMAYQWLRPDGMLTSATVEEAISDQRAGAAGYPRGLGWVLHHEGTFFDALGPRSFGHTGFTGTSVALDPDEDLIAVLLTNRVHLGGNNTKIQEFRPQFHQAVRGALR